MRILAVMTRDMFRLTLGWALEDLGHNVHYLSLVREDLLEFTIRSFCPDLILTVGWDLSLRRAEIVGRVAKMYHVFQLYFAEEDWLHFERCSLSYCQVAQPNLVLTRSAKCSARYRELGIPSIYLDVACNPSFHRSVRVDPRFQCDVAVVANSQLNQSSYRKECVRNLVIPLIGREIDMRIWGKGWDTELPDVFGVQPAPQILCGVLPFHLTVDVYNSAIVNIGIQTVMDQVSNRTYDILASGGFLLTSETEAVKSRLTHGIHCVITQSEKDTIDCVMYYLYHPDERERIVRAGQELAVHRFSYQRTLQDILGKVEEAVRCHQLMSCSVENAQEIVSCVNNRAIHA